MIAPNKVPLSINMNVILVPSKKMYPVGIIFIKDESPIGQTKTKKSSVGTTYKLSNFNQRYAKYLLSNLPPLRFLSKIQEST